MFYRTFNGRKVNEKTALHNTLAFKHGMLINRFSGKSKTSMLNIENKSVSRSFE